MPAEPPTRRTEEPDEKKSISTDQRIADLEAALAASRGAAPLNPIPEHGAGQGTEVAETWSLYEQEQARANPHKPTPTRL